MKEETEVYEGQTDRQVDYLVQSSGLGQAAHGQNSACAVDKRDTAVLINWSLNHIGPIKPEKSVLYLSKYVFF